MCRGSSLEQGVPKITALNVGVKGSQFRDYLFQGSCLMYFIKLKDDKL